MQELYHKTRDAAHWAVYITEEFRNFNLDSGIRLYRNFLTNMQWILRELLASEKMVEQLELSLDRDYVMSIVQGLLAAQEQKDYVLLGDLVELQALPFLTGLLDAVRAKHPEVETTSFFEQNLLALEKKDAALAQKIRQYQQLQPLQEETAPLPHIWQNQKSGIRYLVEPTTIGYPTCRIETEQAKYYLHSNKDPYDEAHKWAATLMDETTKAYHIMGGGLGYEGITLFWGLKGNYPVHSYEADLNLLYLGLTYVRFTATLSERLYLHYDPDYSQLLEATSLEGHKLCIYQPSLRGIRDEKRRAHFERFFLQDSSYRNAKILLQGNFDANIDSLESEPKRIHLVSRLREVFWGKNVFIVAAGPSLDKNVMLLSEKPANSLILATGTVFKKLLALGIRPDYVIVTDANERVLFQISGAEQETVPMLMLSTANHKFVTRYQAEHYLIFQNGYDRAESAAELLHQECFETGGSVSTTALDVAIRLGARQVIFLGLDLAFTDNLAHAAGTSNRIATDPEELLPVKGQDGGTVYADHKFILYREWIERRLQNADVVHTPIVNATEGGSYIEGMQHRPLAEVLEELRR